MKHLRIAATTGELCMCHEEGQALLKVLQPALMAKVLSDDGDFCTVAGITLFTANRSVIQEAASQGRLAAR